MSDAPFRMQVGFETDIGGGRENQDDFLVFTKPSLGVFVGCVFDGHGREVGKVAANSAKACLAKMCEDDINGLVADPGTWLVIAHTLAHFAIKEAFRNELEGQGFEISEDEKSCYLLKRKPPSHSWTCVHGGSSCSIVVIIGTNMYVGNVGDSTGIICSTAPALNHSCLQYRGDAAIDSSSKLNTIRGSNFSQYLQNSATSDDHTALGNVLVVTAEHSPESPYEFYRLREFRPKETDPMQPSLLVVYDSPSHEKSRCNPVFELDNNGMVTVTNNGKYYKNVRKEWASLVSTPLTARFQDALAFTRSLGDLHLSSYGVTHLPEVQHIDLAAAFLTMTDYLILQSASSCDKTEQIPPPLICMVLATDGVWDNWTYEDVTKFVLDSSCLNAVVTDPNGAHRVTQSFMARNNTRAKQNFGGQADNATGIVLYISPGISNGAQFEG